MRISPPPEQGAGDGDGNVRAAKPVGGCLLAPYMPERVDIESSARRTLGRGMAVWRIRRRSARRVAAQLVASTIVAAVAAVGLATTAAAQDGFADVSSRSHKANIEALAETGLFEGTECGEQQFCPNDPANRWTVAVWIVRALDGSSPPPPVAQSRFVDVDDDEWWMPYLERLADLRITFGCKANPLSFCPDETVTRARMASFLVRAFNLAEAPSAGFADTEGSTHEANIDALFAAGITVGCKQDPLRYCPNDPVSRAQMATLLKRVLDSRPEPASFTIGEGPRSGDTLLAATRGHTCAVRRDTTVACWGDEEGLLEHLSASGLTDVVALSTGQDPGRMGCTPVRCTPMGPCPAGARDTRASSGWATPRPTLCRWRFPVSVTRRLWPWGRRSPALSTATAGSPAGDAAGTGSLVSARRSPTAARQGESPD